VLVIWSLGQRRSEAHFVGAVRVAVLVDEGAFAGCWPLPARASPGPPAGTRGQGRTRPPGGATELAGAQGELAEVGERGGPRGAGSRGQVSARAGTRHALCSGATPGCLTASPPPPAVARALFFCQRAALKMGSPGDGGRQPFSGRSCHNQACAEALLPERGQDLVEQPVGGLSICQDHRIQARVAGTWTAKVAATFCAIFRV